MATIALHKPTVPRWLALLARCLALTILILVGHWVHTALQGVSLSKANSNGIFGWHPVLMTLGFVIFMTEALLAYKAPIVMVPLPRPYGKLLHWICHSLAVACISLGLIAVFRFHAIISAPNLYSPHSYLGLLTVSLLATQFVVGLLAYLWPKAQPRQRAALGPYHAFAGLAIWGLGLATIATGLQEKVGFLQANKAKPFSAAIRVPATSELFLALLALTVLFIHAFHSAPGTAGLATSGSGGLSGPADAALLDGRESSLEEAVALSRG